MSSGVLASGWAGDPNSYELRVLNLLARLHGPASSVQVNHQEMLVGDTRYTVDGTLRFEQGGMQFLIVVECKLLRRRVERRQVQILSDTLEDVHAQKAVFVTSTGFQSGAVELARRRNIALAISDGEALHFDISITDTRAQNIDQRYVLAA